MFFWAYPISLWIGYIVSHLHQAARVKAEIVSVPSERSATATRLLKAFHISICCSLLGTFIIALRIVVSDGYGPGWTSKNYLSSTVGVGLFYLAGLLPDPDTPYSQSQPELHMWIISVIYETVWLFTCKVPCFSCQSIWEVGLFIHGASRVLIFICLITIYWGTARKKHEKHYGTLEENRSFLNCENRSYGASELSVGQNGYAKKGDAQTATWVEYALGFRKLIPFLWPSDSGSLQARAIFCFVLLLAQRIVNILTPHQLGVVVNSLGSGQLPHRQLVFYILFRGLQGQQGVIGSFRALLWIPISQSTYRRLSSAAFEHVLQLSLDFHLSKRVGEVMSALSKGGALNTFLDGFVFQLFPMVADLWIAAGYFCLYFDAFYSLMVISVTWFYIYITIYMAKYRGRARREMVRREREMEAAKTDALLSYETVHHSGAVPMEISRYESLIAYFQKAEYHVFFSLNVLNAVQNGVFTLGTLLVCYLNAYQISVNLQEVAMFVTLITYLAQLQAPLSFFGSFYTQVQNNLVDAERMLELFGEKSGVTDREDAVDVDICNGGISFSNVSFAYNGRNTALHDVSFKVPPGTSTAIVGESGSGKSTILKLLFRFYDTNHGQIKMDSLDIRDICIDSLRSHIGVVPQDTILFNDTLMYNLLYANPRASQDEVHAACRAASIHHRILDLPHGYSTPVGERGLKLSGGERQRIAIARAFLRTPRILLLDEATSSLDSETERQIQGSLEKVSEGRTTITIAHRLSTVTKADQIIVLHQGTIVERGTHLQLLTNGGQYAKMWQKQTEAGSDGGLDT
ncbi:P-loop containing nucleoside triphosphate hydrolase protein [Xylariaceae sp. AK1471]|nr:P-loop containing nucleoside triphosphate hydrolase protein [Xylariaceae sp. AK1471]